MTCAERMRRIRMIETMNRLYQNGDNQVEKTEDGIRYYDSKGNVLIEAKMTMREA